MDIQFRHSELIGNFFYSPDIQFPTETLLVVIAQYSIHWKDSKMNLPLTLLSQYITIELEKFPLWKFLQFANPHSTKSDNEKLKQVEQVLEEILSFSASIMLRNTDFLKTEEWTHKRHKKV